MTDVITLARQCFEGFRDALMTGRGELLAVRVAEDVMFRVPVPSPDWQGEQRGRDRVRALIAFEYETLRLRARFLEKAVFGTGPIACVLFDIEAEADGRSYVNHNCLVVTVEAGTVTRFEEYSGQMDPVVLLPIMQAQLGHRPPSPGHSVSTRS